MQSFCQIRHVRKLLWQQPGAKQLHTWLKSGGEVGVCDRVGAVGTETLLSQSCESLNEVGFDSDAMVKRSAEEGGCFLPIAG